MEAYRLEDEAWVQARLGVKLLGGQSMVFVLKPLDRLCNSHTATACCSLLWLCVDSIHGTNIAYCGYQIEREATAAQQTGLWVVLGHIPTLTRIFRLCPQKKKVRYIVCTPVSRPLYNTHSLLYDSGIVCNTIIVPQTRFSKCFVPPI